MEGDAVVANVSTAHGHYHSHSHHEDLAQCFIVPAVVLAEQHIVFFVRRLVFLLAHLR